MNKIRVVWGRNFAIGESPAGVRTMTMEFGSATKAADYACDILYMLGQDVTAHSDKNYVVSKAKPVVEWKCPRLHQWLKIELIGG